MWWWHQCICIYYVHVQFTLFEPQNLAHNLIPSLYNFIAWPPLDHINMSWYRLTLVRYWSSIANEIWYHISDTTSSFKCNLIINSEIGPWFMQIVVDKISSSCTILAIRSSNGSSNSNTLLSSNSWLNANFSFTFSASYVWYSLVRRIWQVISVEVKVCLTTNSPNTVHTFCSGQAGKIKVWKFGVD